MASYCYANCCCRRVVFLGNIAFHSSEQEIRDACELIGPVVSLSIAADAATGKRKGYAFVEYRDDETARSACRNLHGHFLRGRDLSVRLADRKRRRPGPDEPVGMEDAVHAASLVPRGIPNEGMTQILANASRNELKEMVRVLESWGSDCAEQVQEVVPGLAFAVKQARILLEMAAEDDTAEEARKRKRSSVSALAEPSDHCSKQRKVGDGKPDPVPQVAS